MKLLLKQLLFITILTSTMQGLQAQLFINELSADNDAVIADNNGEYDDWIEIYNQGTQSVDIGGYYLTDDFSNPTKFQIPTGTGNTTVPAGGWLLIWADDDASQGPLHATFRLSASGEEVGFYDDNQNVVDSVSFGPQATDQSYGRATDGGTPWQVFTTPTPEAANAPFVSTKPAVQQAGIRTWPNPVTGSGFRLSKAVNATLFDQTGKAVRNIDNQDFFNTEGLPAGWYILRTAEGFNKKVILR